MCVPHNTSLQAEDLAYSKTLQKLLQLTSQEPPKLRATPFGRQLSPTSKPVASCIDAAKRARDAAIKVHQLNARRSDIPYKYQAEVVDTIVRATIYLADHGEFSFELVDEALILANYHHTGTDQLLALIRSHSGCQPSIERPVLSLKAFEKQNSSAPFPDLISVARNVEHFRDLLRFAIPCVMRSTHSLDQEALVQALNAAAETRYVPAECSTDFRSNTWRFGIRRLSLAIEQGDYVAQFPLHEHLQLDLSGLGHLSEVCGRELQSVVNCWFGPAGTRTPHHTDDYENLYVSVLGYKFFQILRPTAEINEFLQPLSGVSVAFAASLLYLQSLRNVTSLASAALHSSVPELQVISTGNCWNVTLGPGDILYIPRGFWHMAQSLSWHLGLSNWFLT